MAKRHKQAARRKRNWLRSIFGGECLRCGHPRNLTFDVIKPVDNGEHWKLDSERRMSFYMREFWRNNIQLLCVSCNSNKGRQVIDYRKQDYVNKARQLQPF